MYLKQLTNEQFENFINRFQYKSMYQTVEYAFVMNKQKFDSIFLGLFDNENIVAASIFLIEKRGNFKYAYAPKGFLIDYNNEELVKIFSNEVKKYLGKMDVIAVKLNPMIIRNTYDNEGNIIYSNPNYENIFNMLKKQGYYHLGYNNEFEALKPRFEAILDLKESTVNLFKNIRKEFKTKIRSAEKNGIKIYKGTSTNLNYLYLHTKSKYPRDLKYFEDCYYFYSKKNMVDFYYAKLDTKVFLQTVQQNYQLMHEESYNFNNEIIMTSNNNSFKRINKKIALETSVNNYKMKLIEATNLLSENPNGIILASILVIKNNDTINILIDGHDPKYKKFNAKHLLLWKIIEKYKGLGYKKFNFGGIANPTIKNSKYKGLNEFRLSFNPYVNEYIGDLELVTNNALYFMYRNTSPIRKILKK